MTNTTNTGDWNSGYRNSGYRNSGDCNSGYRNSGNWNTGNRNSGNCNSGYHNSGNWNTGDWNTGNWNKTNYSTGFFNTVEQPLYMFNKLVEGASKDSIDAYLEVKLTEWVLPENMTETEKTANPSWETCEGYLKERTFEEACRLAWEKASEKTKQKFLGLPNFDSAIFKEITGIDVAKQEETIKIEGKEFTVSEIKKALKI